MVTPTQRSLFPEPNHPANPGNTGKTPARPGPVSGTPANIDTRAVIGSQNTPPMFEPPRTISEYKAVLTSLRIVTEQEWNVAVMAVGRTDDVLRVLRKLTDTPSQHEAFADHPTHVLTQFQLQQIVNGSIAQLRLAHFLILDRLGAGGMGEVFLARDLNLSQLVAIKTIVPGEGGTMETKVHQRFELEAKLLVRLRNPGFPMIYFTGAEHGVKFIAMEFVKGQTLKQIVDDAQQEGDTIPIWWGVQKIRAAALALQHAHENNIIHRDIKPANIMITDRNEVKVLDLGIGKLRADMAKPVNPPGGQPLTMAGTGMGTPEFMPPEQWYQAAEVTPAADVYSLGVTLFYLLAGDLPFKGDMSDLLTAHYKQGRPKVSKYRRDVPAGLEKVIAKTLEVKAVNRYASAKDFADALAPFERVPGAIDTKRWFIVAAAVVGVVAIGLVAYTFWNRSNKDDNPKERAEQLAPLDEGNENSVSADEENQTTNPESTPTTPLVKPDAKALPPVSPLPSKVADLAPSEKKTADTPKAVAGVKNEKPALQPPHEPAPPLPANAREMFAKANDAAKRGDWKAAFDFGRQGAKADPTNKTDGAAKIVMLMLERLDAGAKPDEALAALDIAEKLVPERAKELQGRRAQARLELARKAFSEQRWDDTVANLDQSLQADPTFSKAYYLRANVFQKLGKTDQVIEALRAGAKCEKNDQELKRVHLALSSLYQDRSRAASEDKRFMEADNDLLEAERIASNNSLINEQRADLYHAWASHLSANNNNRDALAKLDVAIELAASEKKKAQFLVERARLHDQLGDAEKAKHDRQVAKQLDPDVFKDNVTELTREADELFTAQKFDEALNLYREALNKTKDNKVQVTLRRKAVGAIISQMEKAATLGQLQNLLDKAKQVDPQVGKDAPRLLATAEWAKKIAKKSQQQQPMDSGTTQAALLYGLELLNQRRELTENRDDEPTAKLRAELGNDYLELVRALVAKEPRLALEVVKTAADHQIKGVEWTIASAEAHSALGETEPAIRFWRLVARQDDKNAKLYHAQAAKLHVTRALAALDAGEAAQALEEFAEAQTLDGETSKTQKQLWAKAYRLSAKAHLEKKQTDQALLDLGEALKLHQDAATYLERADILANANQIPQAADDLAKAADLDKENANVHRRKASSWLDDWGQKCLDNNEFVAALDAFSNATTLEPGRKKHFAQRQAIVLARRSEGYKKENAGKAIADLSDAVLLDPDNPVYYAQRARWLTATNLLEEAIADYGFAAARDEQMALNYAREAAPLRLLQAEQAAKTNSFELVQRRLNQARQLDKRLDKEVSTKIVDNLLAWAKHLATEKPDAAAAKLTELLGGDNAKALPNEKKAEIHLDRGRLWRQQGKTELALQDEDAAIALDPKLGNAMVKAAEQAFEQKNFPEAIKRWRRLVDQRPDDESRRQQLAKALVAQVDSLEDDKPHEALAALEEAAKWDKKSKGIPRRRAGLLEKSGRLDEACAQFELEFALASDDETKAKAGAQVARLAMASANKHAANDRWKDVDELAQKAQKFHGAGTDDIVDQWASLYFNRAEAQFQAKKTDAALKLVARALEFKPANLSALLLRAKILDAKEDYQASAQVFLQAAEIDPKQATLHRREAANCFGLHARGLEKKFEYELARYAFVEALKHDPDNSVYKERIVDCTLERARSLKNAKEYDKALSFLRSGQKLLSTPNAPIAEQIAVVLQSRADAHLLAQEYQKSIDDYIEAADVLKKSQPGRANDLRRRAAVAYGKGQGKSMGLDAYRAQKFDDAIAAFEKAVELDGDTEEYKRNLAIVHNRVGNDFFDQKKYEDALASYNKAATVHPANATFVFNAGLCYSFQEKFAEAIESYTRSLELDPKNCNTYSWRGEAYLVGKINYAKARADFEKALEMNAKDSRSLNGLAMLHAHHPDVNKRDVQAALKLSERACEDTRNPKRWEYLLTQASIFARNNEFEEAVKIVEQAAKQPNASENVVTDLLKKYREQTPPHALPPAKEE